MNCFEELRLVLLVLTTETCADVTVLLTNSAYAIVCFVAYLVAAKYDNPYFHKQHHC